MLLALAIIAVMYCFLIPTRYEGVRFAPTNFERWFVMVLSLGSVGAFMIMGIGFRVPPPGDDPWMTLLGPVAAMYVCSIPLRMLLRFRIPNVEQLLIFIALIGGIGYVVMLPMFYTG